MSPPPTITATHHYHDHHNYHRHHISLSPWPLSQPPPIAINAAAVAITHHHQHSRQRQRPTTSTFHTTTSHLYINDSIHTLNFIFKFIFFSLLSKIRNLTNSKKQNFVIPIFVIIEFLSTFQFSRPNFTLCKSENDNSYGYNTTPK